MATSSNRLSPTIYSGNRPHLLEFFDPSGRSVLDVGCGGGGMGPSLRASGAKRLVGIEPHLLQDDFESGYDKIISETIEDVLANQTLEGERFGLILLSDVLEHLVDPWTALRELVSQNLTADGKVFISLPNVANLTVVKQLVLRRDWKYEGNGMFDRTHLRWFGARTAEQLIDQAGLKAETWGGNVRFSLGPVRVKRRVQNAEKYPKIAIFQFYILATPIEPYRG